jgi:mxaJ protein
VIGAGCSRPADVAAKEPSRVLRVCADPNNLPYSNRALEGFENRIASLVGDRLDARIEYTWWAQRRGFIRNTLRAGTCDVVLGLPAGIAMAATTAPYYRSSYMFVTRQGSHQPASFDDPYLATARVGVHIIGDDFSNSPPAHALTNRGLIDNVRGYSVYGDYKSPNPPAELIRAVEHGDIDVAVAWGPLAGYFARRSSVPLQLTRVTPDEEPPFPFVFDMAMGVARSNTTLKDELNRILAENKPAIDAILRDYAVPVIDGPRTTGNRTPETVASR